MKKEENDKIVLDLDKYADSKRLCDLTAEEKAELFKPLNSQIAESFKISFSANKQLQEAVSHIGSLYISSITPNITELITAQSSMTKVMESVAEMTLPMSKMFAEMIDSRRIAQSLFDSFQPSLDIFKNSIIDLNTLNSIGRFSESTLIELQVESAEQISETEAVIESTATTETSFKSVSIVQRADLSIIVSAVSEKIEEKFAEQGRELSDIKTMVRELLEKGSNALPAMVSSFKFDIECLSLTINGKEMNFDRPTKQTELCQIFLGSIKSVKQKLHIEDIIEEYGEEVTERTTKKWNAKFYQAKRHLNDRIEKEVGLKEFIKYTNQCYEVNPEYRKLF